MSWAPSSARVRQAANANAELQSLLSPESVHALVLQSVAIVLTERLFNRVATAKLEMVAYSGRFAIQRAFRPISLAL